MAQDSWVGENNKNANEGKARESAVKTVRFLNSNNKEHCDNKCETSGKGETGANGNPTINMVQNLVPHLPGLDKDKIYVISGPFPNFDPMSGPSQLLMATPVSPGATIIAVPSGPPPANMKQAAPSQLGSGGPQPGGPAFHPVQPHMLHWDCSHPGGEIVPLRQPVPPVYYNVPPSQNSSGLQSPASEGSGSISESSSTSGDQDQEQLSPQLYYHPVPPFMGQNTRLVQGGPPPPPPPYCQQLGPVYMPHHHNGPGHLTLYNQVYISQ